MKLAKQTQKFTEQSKLPETRAKYLFWLLSLLRWSFQWELESRYPFRVTLHAHCRLAIIRGLRNGRSRDMTAPFHAYEARELSE